MLRHFSQYSQSEYHQCILLKIAIIGKKICKYWRNQTVMTDNVDGKILVGAYSTNYIIIKFGQLTKMVKGIDRII